MIFKKVKKKVWDVVILSPHMDDALLSLGQHIINWKKECKKIKIITMVNSFGRSEKIPLYSKEYINKSGFKKVFDFEKARRVEDRRVMNKLDVSYEYWSIIDASFRSERRIFKYPKRKDLLSGKVVESDQKMVADLVLKLNKIRTKKMLIPYGVGGHVDHIILRKVGEESKIKNKFYYLESPYLWEKLNWLEIIKSLLKIKSILREISDKNKLLKVYKSQYQLWGENKNNYLELIIK